MDELHRDENILAQGVYGRHPLAMARAVTRGTKKVRAEKPRRARRASALAVPDTVSLTRGAVAEELGVHKTTVRRWEERGVLQPVVGPDGVHRFDREQLAHVRQVIDVRTRTVPPKSDDYDGETAASVFELFKKGVEAVEVVMRTRLHPSAVRALQDEWMRMRGGYVIDAVQAGEISVLRGRAIVHPEELLASLRERAPMHQRCGRCDQELDTTEIPVCRICAFTMNQKVAEDLAKQAAVDRQQRELAKEQEKLEREHRQRMRELDRDRRRED